MASQIPHPSRAGVCANFGYSGSFGSFFAELWAPDGVVHHGRATTGRFVPLREILGLMVDWGFFEWVDVDLAHQAVQMLLPEEIDDPGVRRAATVLECLKAES